MKIPCGFPIFRMANALSWRMGDAPAVVPRGTINGAVGLIAWMSMRHSGNQIGITVS
jgi:hypothetical protein